MLFEYLKIAGLERMISLELFFSPRRDRCSWDEVSRFSKCMEVSVKGEKPRGPCYF